MKMAIDFDGTIVEMQAEYADLTTPFTLIPGAKEALYQLKAAGHILLLWSARASLALRKDPQLDPLIRCGVVRPHGKMDLALNEARYQQMLDFVEQELPGVFDAIDDGTASKPSVDLFIDDKAVQAVGAQTWRALAEVFGQEEEEEESGE
jgi:beta-phosphoglucomutase-like phosphatase (HAD superfamily)